MAPVLVCLILVLCLLISVVKYTLALILKWSVPKAVVKKDFTYQPTVSVLMPCFNEGKTVYETIESISKSNYPNDKFEVIAQDDCSVDNSYEWALKAQRDFTNIRVRVGRNTVNSGKARSVCNALQLSTADMVISIDSDCIFHPDAIRELAACFSEPKIGSVGSRELDLQRRLPQRLPIRYPPRAAPRNRAENSQPSLVRHTRQPGRRPFPHPSNPSARLRHLHQQRRSLLDHRPLHSA